MFFRSSNEQSNENEIIKKDKESHPNCSYSKEYKSMSNLINNKYQTESFHRILRHCPGEYPIEIFSDKKTNNSSSNNEKNQKNNEIDEDFKTIKGLFGGHFLSPRLFDEFLKGFSNSNEDDNNPLPNQRKHDPFSHSFDFPNDNELRSPQLIPPHRIPRNQSPLDSNNNNNNWKINGPPESI